MNGWSDLFEIAAREVLGDSISIVEAMEDAERLHINIVLSGGSRLSTHTIFLSEDNSKYVIDECEFDNKEFFHEYAKQIVQKRVIPDIIDYYKKGYIKELPAGVDSSDKFDLYLMTSSCFANIFNVVTEEEFNGEKATNVVIEGNAEKMTISFSIKYGKVVWEGNTVKINNRGAVSIDISDTPLEGGIESTLEEMIQKKIRV